MLQENGLLRCKEIIRIRLRQNWDMSLVDDEEVVSYHYVIIMQP